MNKSLHVFVTGLSIALLNRAVETGAPESASGSQRTLRYPQPCKSSRSTLQYWRCCSWF